VRLALSTGVFFGLVLLALAWVGLSLPESLGAVIGVLVGYGELVKHGGLPQLSGPWRLDRHDQ
jgi:hypothetical protein